MLLVFGCTEDSGVDTLVTPESPQSLTITVGSDYFEKDDWYKFTNYVFLTDDQGEIISEGILNNGETTELALENLNDAQAFDMTIVSKGESTSNTNYSFQTFTKVSPSNINLVNSISVEEELETKIKIGNTDGYFRMMLNGGMSQNFDENENIGNLEVKADVKSNFENFYIPLYNVTNETYKYLWIEDIKQNLELSLDYNEVPTPSIKGNIQLPFETSCSRSIYGKK